MDLREVFSILWKHKWLMILSILVGLVLVQMSLSRSYTTYETSIGLLLDEPGFGYGNLNSGLGRALALAQTYPTLIMSEIVQEKVKRKLGSIRGSVTVSAAENAPMVNIKVQGLEPKHIQKVAKTTADVFIDYIRTKQKANKIPAKDRVLIYKIGPPSLPTSLKSRKWEMAFLLFLSPLVAGAAASFILENVEQSKILAKREEEQGVKWE